MWHLQAKSQQYELPKPAVMGIVNVSASSFYNACANVDVAIALAKAQIDAGANIIDVGAEATNPQVKELGVSPEAQLTCLLPVVKAIAADSSVLISIDTSLPQVMSACLAAGAHIINDQRALTVPGTIEVTSEYQAAVCLMHGVVQKRTPGSTSAEVLLQDIQDFLQSRVDACLAAGMAPQSLIIDPGFGGGHFGKNTAENIACIQQLSRYTALDYPVLVGLSRKSLLGDITGRAVAERQSASVAAAMLATQQGAAILRVHDVAETVDMLRVYRAMTN